MGLMKAKPSADADRDAEAGLHDAFPELVEMLQKRHLSRRALFVVVEIGLVGPDWGPGNWTRAT